MINCFQLQAFWFRLSALGHRYLNRHCPEFPTPFSVFLKAYIKRTSNQMSIEKLGKSQDKTDIFLPANQALASASAGIRAWL
jgi:hypothetical protein